MSLHASRVRAGLYGEQTQIVRGAYHRRAKGLVVIESDTVGKKCCAPHYSSGLIPVEIIYVQLALLPRITPRFALAVPTPLKFMSVTKTVRPYLPPWVKDGQILSVLLTMRHAYLTHRAVLPHVSCPTRFYTTISLRIRLVWLQKLKKCHPIYSKFTPQYKI